MRYNDATHDWELQSIDGFVAHAMPGVDVRAGVGQLAHLNLRSKEALSSV